MSLPVFAAMVSGNPFKVSFSTTLLCFTPLIHASFIVTGEVPVSLVVTYKCKWVVELSNWIPVILSCSVAMKLNVRAPIHAATAMLTATVTAMSMIEATTGLRAFLLLNIFIFCLIPPFRAV